MNLESVERDVARRIVDFLSGAVYALDGNIQKVSNGIFLIAPYNVGIMGDFKDELRNKGIFPWNN
jgi:cell division inhibitor SepF